MVENWDGGRLNVLLADFSPSLTGSDATGTVVDGGSTITYPGSWINDDGKLSSKKKLQDNKFYQQFSYVILSNISHATWANIVRKIAHPAGFLEFGQLKVKSFVEMREYSIPQLTNTITTIDAVELTEGGRLLITEGGFVLWD